MFRRSEQSTERGLHRMEGPKLILFILVVFVIFCSNQQSPIIQELEEGELLRLRLAALPLWFNLRISLQTLNRAGEAYRIESSCVISNFSTRFRSVARVMPNNLAACT